MEENKTPRQENLIAGLVGAFFGSLLGVVCIVLIGQLGYVAAVSGLVMAVCALKGYEKFGGALSKKGIAACCIIILVMTYFGNKMDWALSASRALDMGLLDCYQAIPLFMEEGVIESASYWGNLVMLYLFTVLGAVPTIRNALHGPNAASTASIVSEEDEAGLSAMTVYSANQKCLKPYAIWNVFCILSPFIAIFSIGLAADQLVRATWVLPVTFLLLLAFLVLWVFQARPYLRTRSLLYIRQGSLLWQVDMNALNRQREYAFAPLNNSAFIWEALSPEQQKLLLNSVQHAIRDLQNDESTVRSSLKRCVVPLKEMQVVKSTSKAWTVQYETANGSVKKTTIPKVYPELVLEPDAVPQEKGPRFNPLIPVLLIVSCFLPVAAAFLPEPPAVSKKTTAYDLDAIHFRFDERIKEDSPGSYVDPKSETYYFVDPVPYAVAPEEIHSFLSAQLKELDENISKRSHEFVSEDGTLVPLPGPDGKTYQYDGLTFVGLDGAVFLSYAVYLPEQGVAVMAEAVLGNEITEDVRARLTAMLSTVTVDADAQTIPLSGSVELTDENYQTFFAPAYEYGYEQVGRSFIKVPQGMFDDGGYADVYLPYSAQATYNEDGTIMNSSAHGVEITVSFVNHTGTSADIVQEMAQKYAEAKNETVNGELVSDDELDIAVWVSAHEENGALAPLFFYSDVKQPNYYFTAIITYHPDQADEFSAALIEELSDAYGLSLPAVDDASLSGTSSAA